MNRLINMKKILSVTLASLLALSGTANATEQEYQANWQSIDSRETPQWWRDARFGIFIHWGLYSVPAYSPHGQYAEWYWHHKDGNKNVRFDGQPMRDGSPAHKKALSVQKDVQGYQNKVYGEDSKYEDFAEQFTAELFDADHWADIFDRAGARYVVLTSKHHEGYTLWPNKHASESFGRPWNSVEIGPKRDLVGELTEAVNKKANVKMGLYYSIWDWFNPKWLEDKDKYIDEVYFPQIKELITKYKPSVLYTDGDWFLGEEVWRPLEILPWILNENPRGDQLVINDRWGKVRGKHGGYYTTEYGKGFPNGDHAWEETRGIGHSFGYNRHESIDQYASTEDLIFNLVDIVSRGGNFLLDIGPTGDGRIPPIMEARLLEMGDWLKVNGEAIYGTRDWIKDAQWSDGKRAKYSKKDYHYGNPIKEMTIAPKPGYAVKQAYFTKKADNVYAILPRWPESGKLLIKDLKLSKESQVTMLGVAGALSFTQTDKGVEVIMPNLRPSQVPSLYLQTVKFSSVK